jgi:hypothetical protein
MLGKMFPEAQFLITGVVGPRANAHGPNESLDVACARPRARTAPDGSTVCKRHNYFTTCHTTAVG